MNSSMSGWSQRSTPICAPRREPADSTVSQERSNTRMYDTGPEAFDRVLDTHAPRGGMRERLGNTRTYLSHAALAVLGVFFEQHFLTDCLRGQAVGGGGGMMGACGHECSVSRVPRS